MRQKKFRIFLCLLLLLSGLEQHPVYAANSVKKIVVNNMDVTSESALPVIKNGVTLVPISTFLSIPGLNIEWDNDSKIVTVSNQQNGQLIILEKDSSYATINNTRTKLDASVSIINSRVMVPVRFISEAAGAKVGWNKYDKTIYIARPTENVLSKLGSSNLPDVRDAAVNLAPAISSVEEILPVSQDFGHGIYIFPAGEGTEYFYQYSNVVSYHKIKNGINYELWRAQFKSGPNDFFFKKKSVRESGEMPETDRRFVYYKTIPAIGEAEYGFIGKTGFAERLGTREMNSLHDFFEIPEEKTK